MKLSEYDGKMLKRIMKSEGLISKVEFDSKHINVWIGNSKEPTKYELINNEFVTTDGHYDKD